MLPDIEAVSAAVHDAWMASKRAQNVTSRKAEDGEELMVPYAQLSEKAKQLDRGSVQAVYNAINEMRSESARPEDVRSQEHMLVKCCTLDEVAHNCSRLMRKYKEVGEYGRAAALSHLRDAIFLMYPQDRKPGPRAYYEGSDDVSGPQKRYAMSAELFRWNHRVISFAEPSDGSIWYAIHEVHYDKDMKPESYTENPVPVCSETIDGMRWQLEKMLACLNHPVLKETDFTIGSDARSNAADGSSK